MFVPLVFKALTPSTLSVRLTLDFQDRTRASIGLTR